MNRRDFMKFVGAASGAAVTAGKAEAAVATDAGQTYGVLVDLSRCIGCRMCEEACATANGLPDPDWSDDHSYEALRPTTEKQWTVVNRHDTSRGEVYVKSQCMHCVQPACAAGCLTKALHKTGEGPVVWRENKCMGCRYCMVACPFDSPKFEYHAAVPNIEKCQLCHKRLVAGEIPACVEACAGDALTFGTRAELLEIARERIYQNPGEYVSHIYGEHEVGGTGWLYISPVPFEEVGFRTDLGTRALPEMTREFLTAVPLVLVGFPALLLALRRATAPQEVVEEEDETFTAGDPLPAFVTGKEN